MRFAVLGRARGCIVVVALLAIPAHARDSSLHLVPPLPPIMAEPAREPELSQADAMATASSLITQRLDALVERGRHWRFETDRGPVHAWIPEGYDAATAATIVFVHGYHVDVDQAWADYRLPHQFALSGINAMFVAPGAPAGKHDSITWPSLHALVATVKQHVDVPVPKQRLVAVGHSGAYRTLAVWLANTTLDTIILLDAVYGEYRFVSWVHASRQHRLINIAYETTRYSDYMHRSLPETKRVDGLPLEGLPDGRVIYATTDVGHWEVVMDGVALPLALRAIGVSPAHPAAADLPLGLPASESAGLPLDLEVDSSSNHAPK